MSYKEGICEVRSSVLGWSAESMIILLTTWECSNNTLYQKTVTSKFLSVHLFFFWNYYVEMIDQIFVTGYCFNKICHREHNFNNLTISKMLLAKNLYH